ncbi:MAG: hypothetical protein M1827_004940 [Pycnora praestabilis]|nr:MAG: hypothetical protein M1827_004940 [Pycnora praestabilis]
MQFFKSIFAALFLATLALAGDFEIVYIEERQISGTPGSNSVVGGESGASNLSATSSGVASSASAATASSSMSGSPSMMSSSATVTVITSSGAVAMGTIANDGADTTITSTIKSTASKAAAAPTYGPRAWAAAGVLVGAAGFAL